MPSTRRTSSAVKIAGRLHGECNWGGVLQSVLGIDTGTKSAGRYVGESMADSAADALESGVADKLEPVTVRYRSRMGWYIISDPERSNIVVVGLVWSDVVRRCSQFLDILIPEAPPKKGKA